MFINKPPQKINVELFEVGPAILHNLTCWICDKYSSVYDIQEQTFRPCWRCQKKIKDKTLRGKLRNLLRKFL